MIKKAWLLHPAFWIEVFVLFNLAFLALDIYIAHSINQFGHAAEWIPFGFSILATALLASFLPRTAEDLISGRSRIVGGAIGVGSILTIARLGVRNIAIYTILGAGVWLAFHESGVHATIAGVILGLITPVKSWVPEGAMGDFVDRTSRLVRGEGWQSAGDRYDTLRRVETAARESSTFSKFRRSALK